MKNKGHASLAELFIIVLFIIVVCIIMFSCRAIAPFTIRADFYISTITRKDNICIRDKCDIFIGDHEVMLKSTNYDIVVNKLVFGQMQGAVGKDQNGKEWEVLVSTMEKDPYLLLLKADTVAILIGAECY